MTITTGAALFDPPGRADTAETLRLAAARAETPGIQDIIVASNTGETALLPTPLACWTYASIPTLSRNGRTLDSSRTPGPGQDAEPVVFGGRRACHGRSRIGCAPGLDAQAQPRAETGRPRRSAGRVRPGPARVSRVCFPRSLSARARPVATGRCPRVSVSTIGGPGK